MGSNDRSYLWSWNAHNKRAISHKPQCPFINLRRVYLYNFAGSLSNHLKEVVDLGFTHLNIDNEKYENTCIVDIKAL